MNLFLQMRSPNGKKTRKDSLSLESALRIRRSSYECSSCMCIKENCEAVTEQKRECAQFATTKGRNPCVVSSYE